MNTKFIENTIYEMENQIEANLSEIEVYKQRISYLYAKNKILTNEIDKAYISEDEASCSLNEALSFDCSTITRTGWTPKEEDSLLEGLKEYNIIDKGECIEEITDIRNGTPVKVQFKTRDEEWIEIK